MIQSLADRHTDGQTDMETDEQMDQCDFIGLRPTKVEHPKIKKYKYSQFPMI